MTARAAIIQSALTKLALASYVFDIEPEERRTVLDELDALMAEWAGNDIAIGYVPANGNFDLTIDAGTPDWATNGIACNLALRLAPSYGKEPSSGLKGQAKAGYDLALTKTATIPTTNMTTRTPKGAGNGWPWRRWPYGNFYPSAPRSDT